MADEHRATLDRIEVLLKRLSEVNDEARQIRAELAELFRKARGLCSIKPSDPQPPKNID